MADFANKEDVEENWRSLSAAEVITAETWLAAASAELRFLAPGLDARIAADLALPESERTWIGTVVRDKVAWAVRHRLKGADARDRSVEPHDSFWFGSVFLDALRAGSASVNRTTGSFPVTAWASPGGYCYPNYIG